MRTMTRTFLNVPVLSQRGFKAKSTIVVKVNMSIHVIRVVTHLRDETSNYPEHDRTRFIFIE